MIVKKITISGYRLAWLFAIVFLTHMIQGCAFSRYFGEGEPPQALESVGFKSYAQSKTQGDVTVSVAVLTARESQAAFGVPLEAHDIQPVWIEVENRSAADYIFLPIDLDPDYFAPFELAWKYPNMAVGDSFEDKGVFFRERHMPLRIPAGGKRSGLVFTHLDRGVKAIDIELVAGHASKRFRFVVQVPGLKADYLHVDWESLFPAEDYRDLDREQLKEALSSLPCCALGGDRKTPGDPLNLVIIGSPDYLFFPLIYRGWDPSEIIHGAAVWETIKSSLFGAFYRYSPVSPLYVFDRPQDIALQKARSSVDERNHLRLWLTPLRYRGMDVYIGQISRDIGIKLSSRTLVTHKIDPEVDEARDYFAQDLLRSGFVKAFGFVKGVGKIEPENPRYNYTKDPYWTDGARAVFILSEESVLLEDIERLNWE